MLEQAQTPQNKKLPEVALKGSKYYEEARELAFLLASWANENREAGRPFFICSGGRASAPGFRGRGRSSGQCRRGPTTRWSERRPCAGRRAWGPIRKRSRP